MTPRTALMFALMLPLITTCQLLRPKKETAKPDKPEPTSMRAKALAGEGCSCQTVISLIDGLEACERRAKKCEPVEEEDTPEPKVKTRTITVQGPPKKCSGGKRPDIVPVPQSECQKGMICLGDKGQRALAINLAAYEKFVNQVLECENGK